MPELKFCIAQMEAVPGNPGESLLKAEKLAELAAGRGADIISFSEQFATGWDPDSVGFSEGERGPVNSFIRNTARRYGIGILGSFREKTESGIRNTAVFADKSGEVVCRYSKIHLFSPGGEDRHYIAGDTPASFEFMGVRFGLAICYDLRFPELFSHYQRAGCDCVIVQAAWPKARIKHWDILTHARAIENQYYIAGVNATGKTSAGEYNGNSLVVSPKGETVIRADDSEGIFCTTISLNEVKRARQDLRILSDRREYLYIGWRNI
ncbi:carbon-nitrogen hydrolase family protein [Methanoplanus sp. FWC-SCC4]|uniref:Carbon-nitrogen hydrolase family protein n=1 Tax=Methanochimaera problematica TaxID=2609417 RepID=A0AA97FE93_9EURY|nr:nitrilase-related carbon-nitrogen hydrolase [Methanoplanus sp. FWC-SCC4]WOF17247.1 carbon-nitrogen hydrolase family protein [Methanoplanus sp. FWC-SCC4]